MKNILLNIYKFFVAQEFKFEHLGKIVQSIKHPAEQNLATSAIYTTGLYSSVIFDANKDISSPQSVDIQSGTKLDLIADEKSVVKEVLDLTEKETSLVENTFYKEVEESPKVEDQEEQAIPPLVADQTFEESKPLITSDSPSTTTKTESEDLNEDLSHGQKWEEINGPLSIDDVQTAIEPVEKEEKKKKRKKKTKAKDKTKKKQKKGKKAPKLDDEIEYSAFTSWLSSLDTLPGVHTKDAKKLKSKKKKKKKNSAVKISAKKSITKKEGIVSETLATLLISQGHIDDGIAMLEQLKLINPDKADHYQFKIEGIKR